MIILLIITIFIHHYLLYFEEGWREFHCSKVCWHHKEAFAKINSEKEDKNNQNDTLTLI